MDLFIELFKLSFGWAYKVGAVYQEYHPEKEGFQSMSYQEASECAKVIYDRLTQ